MGRPCMTGISNRAHKRHLQKALTPLPSGEGNKEGALFLK